MAKLIDVLEHEALMHYRDKVGVLLRQAASEIRALQNRLRRKASGKKQSLALTDEEREAVAIMERVANRTENLVVGIGPRHAKSFDGPTIAATLRGLLERTNYPAKGDSSTGLR